jgi:hypothetical protein
MKRYMLRTFAVLCAVLVIPSQIWAACVNPPAGLVSWWPAEGNGNDIAGSNPATVGSGVSFRTGEVAQAFNFAGTGAVVVAASGSLDVGVTTNGFSIECWIKPNDLSTRRPLLEWRNGSNNGVLFSTSDSSCGDSAVGNLFANIVDASGNLHPIYSGVGLLTVSNFQHVALTYDKGTGIGTLYINGTVVARANLGSFTPQTSYPLYIGQSVVAGNLATFSGLIDEVSLYGSALSQLEVRSIYTAGASGKCHPTAPFIVTQPSGQLTVVGGNASFSVVAGGSQPLSYQWRLEGNALSGATNSALNLSNVQLSDAGNYSVVVANGAGSVTSSNALLTVSTGGCATASSSLVSWWAGEGNGSDVLGNNPGTVNGGVSYSAGEVGQAFNFDGTSGTIVVPASGTLNVGASSGFSVECWIKPSDVSVRHPIVEWNNGSSIGAHFYVSHGWYDERPGDLMANIEDTGGGWHPIFSAAGLVNTNSFQHVALTYDKSSGAAKLYLNGAVVASANLGSFTPQTTFPMYIGQRPSDNSVALYSGLMDELSVYGKALSQGEIQAIYIAGASGKCQSSSPPFIVNQPASQSTVVGGSASFSVTAGGSQPLSYQWRLGSNALNGATASVLNLSNVQLSDAGNYSVVVSNAFGTVTSSNASLTVNEAVCTNAPAGIVSWWPGEGNGGDIAGSNPGTVNGGVSYSVGEVGQAFNFNGASGTIVVPASSSLNVGLSNGFSVECWIKPADLTVRHPIVEWNNGSSIGVHFYVSHGWYDVRPGDLMANMEDTGGGWHPILTAAGLLNTNSFQHVALTYDKASGVGKLYLNGAVVASENLGSFTPQTSLPMYIGQRPSDGSVALYSGLMDELSLYARALSLAEIQTIYNAGASGKCQGSSAPFILNQPANQTANVGGSASFSVTAGGSQPLSYQWRLGTNALSGATGAVLNLSNVQLSDAGNYSVVVSNAFGTVTSSNALLTVNTGGCVSVPGGIVSWWPAEGNGADVAGSNPGTVSSGVSYSAGEVGQAFNFNGTSGTIAVPASSSLNVGASNGFTVECWIKPAELSVRHPIVEWSDGSNIGVHFYVSHGWFDTRPGDLMANIEDTSGGWHPVFTAAGLLNTNSFQHVALTYDKASGLGKLYLNGAVVASENLGSFTPQTSFPMYVGQRPSDNTVALYSGLMDELSVYGKALSQTEIQAIYEAGASGKCQSSAAPFILNQPTNRTTVVGGSASFSVTAGGSQPLNYQWRLGSNALSGATASVLSLTNVQLSDAGNYSVVVSNAFGTVTSSNAVLTVNTGSCASVAGIVSWWPAEGNGNDVAGSNPGTVNSGVSYSAGEVGQAFNYNGTSGTVVVPASGSMNVGVSNGFTVECWIKPNDLSQRHPIVEWGTASDIGVHFYVSHGWYDERPGNLMANIAEGVGNWHPLLTGPGLLNTTNLQHVALTYDKASGVGKLYLNGAVVASDNLGSFTPQTSYPMYVGQRPSDSSVALYSGLMDELSLYARALNQTEIQAIYNAGASGKCPAGQPIANGGNGNVHATKMLQPVRVSGGYQINFAGASGGSYVIQRAPTVSGPWTTLTTVVVGTNGTGSYVDRSVLRDSAFYRTVVQ